jgi:hypothetical protein
MNGLAVCPSGHVERLRRLDERLRKDRCQTVFGRSEAAVIEVNPRKFAEVSQKGIDPYVNTRCPFCLSFLPFSKFLVSLKSKKGKGLGFDRGKGKCPECGQGMRLDTLLSMRKWLLEGPLGEGVKLYARWVFDYRKSGFFQKIKFSQFNSMLKSMKVQREFWDEYKRLKGDLPDAKLKAAFDAKWAEYEEAEA